MKRTRKWAFVAQEATRLAALGLSAVEIAERLDVTRRSVDRWMKAGKLKRVSPESGVGSVPVQGRKSPGEWAAEVRTAYALDATDDQLVTMAQQALECALDPLRGVTVQLAAMGRFQAIVKQLALVARNADAEVEPPKPAERRIVRTGTDPRALLMAVK